MVHVVDLLSCCLAGLFHLDPSCTEGLVTLNGYITFWGWVFTAVTLALALFQQEQERYDDDDDADVRHSRPSSMQRRQQHQHAVQRNGKLLNRVVDVITAWVTANGSGSPHRQGGRYVNNDSSDEKEDGFGKWWQERWLEIQSAYQQLWGVVKLPAIWQLSLLLLTYRLGVLPAEGAASLKLLDKGVAKEALAALILVQFPVELLSAVIAGRWASTHSPYHPFLVGYFIRLVMAVALTALTAFFPPNASSFTEHAGWFSMLSGIGLVTSFSSTLMFTALGSFFNKISDPGGSNGHAAGACLLACLLRGHVLHTMQHALLRLLE